MGYGPTPSTAPPEPRLTPSPHAENNEHWLTREDVALINRLAEPSPPPTAAAQLTLGTTTDGRAVTITDTDRTRHIYLIGGTGSGKSVTLTNLAIQDIESGEGFTIIDPHGDLAQGVLTHVPWPIGLDRVTYFDATQEDAPPFNLLAVDFEPSKLTADLVATFKMFFGESWGPQMEALLANAINTLLMDRVHEPHCFADLRRLLVDEDYRTALVKRCPDDIQRSFWEHEYKSMTKDAARPILTRLSTLLMAGSPLRRVLTTTENALDLGRIMNERRVLLVNLSKGALGDGPSRLLGGLFVTAITQAALARQSIPEKDRTPHTLYCDEFQNFADLPSTESILSEARKYQLRLVLAHQTMAQVDARLMQNILGNVRTVVGFNVSPNDASVLARRMGRERKSYPDTGDTFDLGVQRQRVAALFKEKMHSHFDGTATVPIYNCDGDPSKRWVDSGAYPPPVRYGRKGFPRTYAPAAALEWLRSVEHTDPNTFDPGQPTEFKWHTKTWPTAQDFQNLPTCHAFAMRNVASSTCDLRVPFPPPAPYPDNLTSLRRMRQTAREMNEKPRDLGRQSRERERDAMQRGAAERAQEVRQDLDCLTPEQRARLGPEEIARMEAMTDPAWWSPTSPDENRPHQKPQDARNATDAGQTPHQEPTKSPAAPRDDFDDFLT